VPEQVLLFLSFQYEPDGRGSIPKTSIRIIGEDGLGSPTGEQAGWIQFNNFLSPVLVSSLDEKGKRILPNNVLWRIICHWSSHRRSTSPGSNLPRGVPMYPGKVLL